MMPDPAIDVRNNKTKAAVNAATRLMSVHISEHSAIDVCKKKMKAAGNAAKDIEAQISGLKFNPAEHRKARLDELQGKRRDVIADYYIAKEELERLVLIPQA